MKTLIKQVAGIDVAQKELVVTLGRMYIDTDVELYAYKTFSNDQKGFASLQEWVKKQSDLTIPFHYVMEATGVYHEKLAYHLSDHGAIVSIVLPNKISNYARTLDVRTVTDKSASQAICKFGLERKLDEWQRPSKVFRDLRSLTRERDQLIAERTVLKNQLHAEQSEAFPSAQGILRLNQRLELLDKQEKQIQSEVAAYVKQDKQLQASLLLLTSIPGIGKLTAIIILAETNGFELIRNKKQLVNYAGLDVKEKQSGTTVKGKPKISKRGNRHLRKSLYMPSLAAIRTDERFKTFFARLVSRHGIKLKAGVAVQKKLLELTYIVWKTQKPYDKNYLQQQIIIKELGQ